MNKHPIFLGAAVIIGTAILILFGIRSLSSIKPASPADSSGADGGATPLEQPTVVFGNPMLGPVGAPLTIVEFGDYECEACQTLDASLKKIVKEHPDAVRFVWKDFPNTSIHPQAADAAEAARCAQQQGAFWEMHDGLFAGQSALGPTVYGDLATRLNLDAAEFGSCMSAHTTEPIVQRDFEEGQRLRIDATPYLFIGKRKISGALEYDQLNGLVENELAALKKTAN